MDLFVFDTAGDKDLFNKNEVTSKRAIFDGIKQKSDDVEEEEESEDWDGVDFRGIPPPNRDISHIIERALDAENKKDKKTKKWDDFEGDPKWPDFGDSSTKGTKRRFAQAAGPFNEKVSPTNVAVELQKSVLKGIEKKQSIECPGARKAKIAKKIERSKTKGKEWFNLPATEVTEEIENDLKILQMRSVLNPKQFYKKNDLKVLPKYFQIGTVQHSPLEHYKEKNTRRNKKKTIVDELLADAEFQKYNKRKYKEVIEKKQRTGYHKANKKMKKLKKNK